MEDWPAAAGLQRFRTWRVSWWVVAAPLLCATQDAHATCSAIGRMPLSVLRCYQCHVPATILSLLGIVSWVGPKLRASTPHSLNSAAAAFSVLHMQLRLLKRQHMSIMQSQPRSVAEGCAYALHEASVGQAVGLQTLRGWCRQRQVPGRLPCCSSGNRAADFRTASTGHQTRKVR